MKTTLKHLVVALYVSVMATFTFASSDPKGDATAKAAMTDGEVRKIDKDGGKLTIKHGEIKNLDMPAMTMVFRVKDPALLDTLKDGDKIKFNAERVGTAYMVTKIEVAK